MQPRRPSHYLKTVRLASGLTQPELGALLGVTEAVVRNVELERTVPTLSFVIAASLLFGKPVERLFPYLYNTVQDELGRRAAEFDDGLRGRTDAVSLKKLELLSAMAGRTKYFGI